MNRTMVIGLSILLCLYLAFGLMGCAHAGCYKECQDELRAMGAHSQAGEAVYPDHESTEIYMLRITTNGNSEQDSALFATAEECEREGAYLEHGGKIRNFTCIPGRGQRPGN